MLAEKMLSSVVSLLGGKYFKLDPTPGVTLPDPNPKQHYMLYMHVPFCEVLCPYCSFNRFPFERDRALKYFESMREEMRRLADRGYTFEEV